MPDLTPATAPAAIRMPEVVNAVLEVLDARGVKVGQQVAFVEIEVAMDARGYSSRWVQRAVAALVDKGVLRAVGGSILEMVGVDDAGAKKRQSRPHRRHRLNVRTKANR